MLITSLLKRWSYQLLAPGTLLREQYEALKKLLQYDVRCHEQMAELQELLYSEQPEDYARVRERFRLFSADVSAMLDALELMEPGKYSALRNYHKKFDFYTRFLLEPPRTPTTPPYILTLDSIAENIDCVGNKAQHLATLQNELNIDVPEAFVITTNSFHRFIEHNNFRETIDGLLASLDIHSAESLSSTSKQLFELITSGVTPADLEQDILSGFDTLAEGNQVLHVAVRSSALGEDGDSSFAGQFETVLNVSRAGVLKAYKDVLASKYSPGAMYYRIRQGWGDEETTMSVLVMKMIPAKFSGVAYTSDILDLSKKRDSIHLHVIDGIGEELVGGRATPAQFLVQRTAPHDIRKCSEACSEIAEMHIRKISALAIDIEKYYQTPQDIEWAVDASDKIFILQARSLHNSILQDSEEQLVIHKHNANALVDNCECASAGTASGIIYRLDEYHNLDDIPSGAVLVCLNTPPDYVKIIHRVSAVLSQSGSRASHFATVAREFGVPFLSAIDDAYTRFTTGDLVTVDGFRGTVYPGRVEELLNKKQRPVTGNKYRRVIGEMLKFIAPLELIDPTAENFTPEGCRSMHDIIRFCHEKGLQALFSTGKPGSARGAVRFAADIPIDVYLFDVGGGMSSAGSTNTPVELAAIKSIPFHALWRGLSHPDVKWKQKPFDWEAYERIELSGAVPPKKDSFAFASYAVISKDYLHFNIRFGYHFTIVDVLCSENSAENHCMLRFAGGGGDFWHRSLRIEFIHLVLKQLGFHVVVKGDLLEAKLSGLAVEIMEEKLDMLGRLLGATKLMDMVLEDDEMVQSCAADFFAGRYSFSQEG
ncbi:PEP/pyruvate-binding domain-containing protein [Desulfosediminicola sp.]|uniref:PEP/pyruvate-binding domain-containing protein n=1 Tax=Desulfosediminicola sp. TaxID=2886825 RepID=UPI003AF28240